MNKAKRYIPQTTRIDNWLVVRWGGKKKANKRQELEEGEVFLAQ